MPEDRSARTPRWCEHIDRVGEYETTIHAWTNDRAEAQRIEAELIATHRPMCNVRAKDTRQTYFGERSDKLDAVSKSERRTVSAMLEIVIEDWLREKGALK
jgi:hypothetical protein